MAIIRPLRGITPQIGKECFLAETATLIGEIILGDHCTVWYNAVLRGDVNFITVGNNTNIQDGCVIHGTYKFASTTLGNDVSIGHNAIIHGCTIHDRVLVGMGAIIMDNAIIESDCVIAAGAVVLPGTIVQEGSVYAGVPAKRVKDMDENLLSVIKRTAVNYQKYASWYQDGG